MYEQRVMDVLQLAEVLYLISQCEDNVHIINDIVISYLMFNGRQSTGWIEFDSMTLKNAKKNRYKLCIVQRGK